MSRARRRWTSTAAAVVAAAVLGGCGGGSTVAPLTTAPQSSVAQFSGESPSRTSAATPTPTPVAKPSVAPAKVHTHPVYVERVRPGQCFNKPKSDVNGFVPVLTTCAAPHDNQMMSVRSLRGGPYSAWDARADQVCSAEFLRFVGVSIDASDLEFQSWGPDAELWKHGDHSVACSVDDPSGKTVGTLRGARR
jgi:hypothetical protein